MNNKRLSLIGAFLIVALVVWAGISTYRARALNDTPLGSNGMEASLAAQLDSDDATARATAATALAGTENREALTALLNNLGDADPAAGYATAMTLSVSEDAMVRDALIAALNNPDVLTRQRAALALSKMAVPEAVPALATSLQDGSVSMAAAQALVSTNTPEAQDALLAALADPELSTQRHAAMAAIENANPTVAGAILGRALASDNPMLVQNATQLREFMGQ